MFNWLTKWKKRRAIGDIRRHMAWFGHDLSGHSDEQIEAAVRRFGEIADKAGISAREAGDNLARAFSRLRR